MKVKVALDNPATGRLKCIDVLRGVASLAVVILHAFNRGQWFEIEGNLPRRLYDLAHYGALGVPLFFVISGFCIHLRNAKAKSSQAMVERDGFVQFWKRRLHRLYPPYFVALCLSMALAFVVFKSNGKSEYDRPYVVAATTDFLLHTLMLHGLHPDYDFKGGNVVFWTLAREEYFYVLYFVAMFATSRVGLLKSIAGVLLVGLCVSGVVKYYPQADHWPEWLRYQGNHKYSAIALWFQWCLGMLAVEAYCGLIKLPEWCRSYYSMAGWAAAWSISEYYDSILAPAFCGLCFFTLINRFVHDEVYSGQKCNLFSRWFGHIGTFSYSLYLVHIPVLMVFQRTELVVREHFGLEGMGNSILYLFLLWLVSIAVALIAGKVFYRLVESRFLNSSRSLAAATYTVGEHSNNLVEP